ncbi:MAG: 30S ribosomal protein S15, partial [Nanoarchaeota archaeon]|nr:30S ribosomal protein S15 [Nanoarchaeota archaeon]
MARMHSRDKGKSGSTKPADRKPIDWVTYSKKELELMVIKIAKEGHKPSMIGLILRDTYGIPSIKDTLGKSIVQVLRE